MEGTKTCPDCAEEVASRAEVCKHCGHAFKGGKAWKRARNRRLIVLVVVGLIAVIALQFAMDRVMENSQRNACESVERGLGVDRDC